MVEQACSTGWSPAEAGIGDGGVGPPALVEVLVRGRRAVGVLALVATVVGDTPVDLVVEPIYCIGDR